MEEAHERSKGTMMISASRSTIQDPETSKNVSLLKMMDFEKKDESQNFQISSFSSSKKLKDQYLNKETDISRYQTGEMISSERATNKVPVIFLAKNQSFNTTLAASSSGTYAKNMGRKMPQKI